MISEIIQTFSCVTTPDTLQQAIDQGFTEIYVQNPSGSVLKHLKLSGNRYARLEVKSVPEHVKKALAEVSPVSARPELNFLPAGKVPYEYFEQIVKFFREVMTLKKADFEAHAWILWSQERGYFISVPKQTVTKASVNFTYDEESLPKGSVIVVDIHSHNTMGAFYSSTDDNNDRTGIYYSGVIGKITPTSYDVVFRFNLYEDKLKCEVKDIFEIPPKPEVTIPAEWMDKVEVQTYQVTHKGGTPGYYSGQNFNGNNAFVNGNHKNGTNNNGKPYDFSKKNRYQEEAQDSSKVPSLWEDDGAMNLNRRLNLAGLVDEEEIYLGGEAIVNQDSRRSLRQSSNEGKEADQAATPAVGTNGEDPEVDEITEQQALDVFNEYSYYEAQYGELVAGAKEDIDVALNDIKTCDEALEDVIRQAYDLLSEASKQKLLSLSNI